MSVQAVAPYSKAVAITKSDTINFDKTVVSTTGTFQTTTNTKPIPCDAILVGGAGIVVAILADGTAVQFTSLDGVIFPLSAIRVNSTTTSATLMYALYYV